jgi:hypothetical protein
LGDEERDAPKNDAMRYLESLLTSPSRPAAAAPSSSTLAGKVASVFGKTAPPPPPAAPAQSFASLSGAWQRIEIEPGFELHVRSDYNRPVDSRGVRKLTKTILDAIFSHVRKPRR